jgi:hypothetical protein
LAAGEEFHREILIGKGGPHEARAKQATCRVFDLSQSIADFPAFLVMPPARYVAAHCYRLVNKGQQVKATSVPPASRRKRMQPW